MKTLKRPALSRTLAFAAAAFTLAAPSAPAQVSGQAAAQTPASQTPATFSAGCTRPTPPAFPSVSAIVTMAPAQMEEVRYERDSYFRAADANLACLDADIEARMRVMFASGAAMDPSLREAGLAHAAVSKDRAGVHEQFIRLCFAYEDARGPLPGGCVTPQSSAALTPR